jgi:hypothetical protein
MAALEADRQMDLSELLSSAWLAKDAVIYRTESLPAALVAMADLHCMTASARSLSLRRVGGRTWGATLLSASLVLTLALLGPSASSDADRDGRANRALASGRTASDARHSQDFFASAIDRPVLLADPDDLNASTFGQNAAPRAADSPALEQEASESESRGDAIAKGAGNGRSSARTDKPAGPDQPRLAEGHGGVSSPASHNKPGEVASGAGAPSDRSPSGSASDPSTGGLAAGLAPRPSSPPPWASADWASDIHRARTALNGGRIPAVYRDLVRGYFSGTTE